MIINWTFSQPIADEEVDVAVADIDADDLKKRTDMLNDDQQCILDELLLAVRDDDTSTCKLFFIDAPGGTGAAEAVLDERHHCMED